MGRRLMRMTAGGRRLYSNNTAPMTATVTSAGSEGGVA